MIRLGSIVRVGIPALLLFAVIGMAGGGVAQQTAPTATPMPTSEALVDSELACSTLVRAAMESTNALCGDTTRNHACYGHVLNTAEFRDGTALTFEAQGDKAPLSEVQSLALSPLDPELEQWGVVLMQAQANLPDHLPGQNVTFIMFGDVSIENAVSDTVRVEATLIETARVHIAPAANRAVIASLAAQSPVIATGRYQTAAGEEWIRITQSAAEDTFGWIRASAVAVEADTLPQIDPTAETLKPMQAFYFRSGIGQPKCSEAPDDGLIIQTPHGAGRVEFNVNGFDVRISSTVFLNLPEAEEGEPPQTCVSLVEGEVEIEADRVIRLFRPGQKACVQMDENGMAVGAPSVPDSFDAAEIALLQDVLSALPEQVVIPDPAPSNTPPPTNTPRPPTLAPTVTPMPTATLEPPTPPPPPPPTAIPVPAPVAGFTMVPAGPHIALTDTSTGAPTSWLWNFGDGNTSTLQNPTHTYVTSGSPGSTVYNIQLDACNAGGCTTSVYAHTLGNCAFDPAGGNFLEIFASPGICSAENYDIYGTDAFCTRNGSPATFVTGPTVGSPIVPGVDGKWVLVVDVASDTVVQTAVLNGVGTTTTIIVGTNGCP